MSTTNVYRSKQRNTAGGLAGGTKEYTLRLGEKMLEVIGVVRVRTIVHGCIPAEGLKKKGGGESKTAVDSCCQNEQQGHKCELCACGQQNM